MSYNIPTVKDDGKILPMEVKCLGTVEFTYTNWRGETRRRRAVFLNIFFGVTDWHPDPQWFVEAIDLEIERSNAKGDRRAFALRDMKDVTYEP